MTCYADAVWVRRKSRSALVAHPKIAEAAVVGIHAIKGEAIYAYVTLNRHGGARRQNFVRGGAQLGT